MTLRTLHPGASILLALATTQPGDVIELLSGVYDGVSTYAGMVYGGASWTTRVKVRAAKGQHPIIKAAPSQRCLWLAHPSASYIEFSGIDFDEYGGGPDAIKITHSVSDEAYCSHHIRLSDCTIKGSPGQGALITSHHNELIRCKVHHNGTVDLDHGIYISGAYNLVQDCDVSENAGWGIHVYNGTDNGADHNRILGNRCYDNARALGRGAGIAMASGTGGVVVGNVCWNNAHGIQVTATASKVTMDRNVLFGNLTALYGSTDLLIEPGATFKSQFGNLFPLYTSQAVA